MTTTALHQAPRPGGLDLPHDERAELLDDLIAPGVELLPADPEIEDARADEIERRLDELESGRVKTIPAEEVFAEARRRLGVSG
ncbi:MAG: addiction module protein [Alphaproteobacteria bacterium]|nr:addiction module protein [Alphaproteobacteria bacterium]